MIGGKVRKLETVSKKESRKSNGEVKKVKSGKQIVSYGDDVAS